MLVDTLVETNENVNSYSNISETRKEWPPGYVEQSDEWTRGYSGGQFEIEQIRLELKKVLPLERMTIESISQYLHLYFGDSADALGWPLVQSWADEDTGSTAGLDIEAIWDEAGQALDPSARKMPPTSYELLKGLRRAGRYAPRINWVAQGKDGTPVPRSQANIIAFLGAIGVKVYKNEFSGRYHVESFDRFDELNDEAMRALRMKADALGLRSPRDFFEDVVLDLARRDGRHPVKDYLARVESEWDGKSRIDDWLIRYAGADDTELNRVFGRIWLQAAVRRVREPGAKFDYLLTLQGPQGLAKSSLAKELAGPLGFDNSLSLGASPKEVIEQTAGKWIVELSELRGSDRENEAIKAMLSRTVDTARTAYARTSLSVPRQFILIGTTNTDKWLGDRTGNRRHWPVRVREIDIEALRRERHQIWGEAAHRDARAAAKGKAIELLQLPPSLYAAATAAQEERETPDPLLERLAEIVGERTGAIRVDELWSIIGVPADSPERRNQHTRSRLGSAMSRLGWASERVRGGSGQRMPVYKKPDEDGGTEPEWEFAGARLTAKPSNIAQFSGGRPKADAPVTTSLFVGGRGGQVGGQEKPN